MHSNVGHNELFGLIQPPPEALLDPAIADDPDDTILQMNHNYNLRPRPAQRNSSIP